MNAVLDQIEEPELLLKQAIREMEESLANSKRQIKLLNLEQQKILGQEDDLKQSLSDMDKQLTRCFESNKDNLARGLIRRKLETTQYLKSVTTKRSLSTESAISMKEQLKEQQSQPNNMKQKADIFKHDNTASDASWTMTSAAIQDEDIEIAFLDEKQKWSQS